MSDLVVKNDKIFRPLFKWAGGKRWFAQRYGAFLTHFRNYRLVEPFAGGLALAMNMQPKYALVNDINPHLINFYQQVKQKNFILPDDFELSKNYYYKIRSEFNILIKENNIYNLRAAQLFWMLNRLGFNGLCRFNQQGYFNTPYGYYKRIFDSFNWAEYESLFTDWSFFANSFEKIELSKKDFLFCDPPYDQSNPVYSKERFNFVDHQRLAEWIKKQNNPAIIMNHPTPRIIDLYLESGFEVSFLMAPRTLSANMMSRQPTQELVASYNFSWKELTKKL